MTNAAPNPSWDALADKLEAIADEMMAAAPAAPDRPESRHSRPLPGPAGKTSLTISPASSLP